MLVIIYTYRCSSLPLKKTFLKLTLFLYLHLTIMKTKYWHIKACLQKLCSQPAPMVHASTQARSRTTITSHYEKYRRFMIFLHTVPKRFNKASEALAKVSEKTWQQMFVQGDLVDKLDISQICSIGLRSGLLAGQGIVCTAFQSKKCGMCCVGPGVVIHENWLVCQHVTVKMWNNTCL